MSNIIRKLMLVSSFLFALAILTPNVEGQSTKPGQTKPKDPPKESPKPKYTPPPPKETPKTPETPKPKYTPPPPKEPEKKDPPKDQPKDKEPPKDAPKPKYSPPSSNPPPKDAPKEQPKTPEKPSDSSKPKTESNDKAQANKEARSERKYEETAKATQPPKTKYTSANGKEVNVKPDSKQVAAIRNQPSTILKPEVREQHTVTHSWKPKRKLTRNLSPVNLVSPNNQLGDHHGLQ